MQKEELTENSKAIEKYNNLLVAQSKNLKDINNTLEGKVKLRTKEIQKSHSELKRNNKDLQKANEELDQFVYSISHQLRAPLVSVLGLVNIATIENPDANQKSYLELIRKSISRLDDSIMEINDYARNTRLELSQDVIDFNEIFNDIMLGLDYIDSSNEIKISKSITQN